MSIGGSAGRRRTTIDVAGNSLQQACRSHAQSRAALRSRAALGARASLVSLALLLPWLLLLLQPWWSTTMAPAGANIIMPEMEPVAEEVVAVEVI